ncbi:MAG: hypothetical protein J6W84_09945, partial [Bacteroidales bacterium]|nr:hypothetical protein [Bacteroidales bacterium]
FPSTIPTVSGHHFGGIGVWIVVGVSDTFCTRQPDFHPWSLVSESCGVENRKCTDNRLIISAFSFVLGSESPV